MTLFVAMYVMAEKKVDRLLLAGSGWNKIVIIDKETKKVEWEYPLERGWECNSVAMTPEGHILFSYRRGAKLVTYDKQEIWNIEAPQGTEIQTAKVLPNGNCLLGRCGTPTVLMEVNAKGEIVSQTEFETKLERPHSQFRQVTKNEQGNYMIPLLGASEIWEVSPAGKVLHSVKIEGSPFGMAPLPNGNWLVGCGDSHFYIELNYKTGEVLRKVNAKDIDGVTLFFVAQLQPTKDGGLYICNWQGHDKNASEANSPQLIELDASGKMVWNLNDNASFGMISAICPL
ncbi:MULTISPECIES: hypothetical protein [unclassified Parabacteroides]|nr:MULTISPECIES: hypothetical protein [unclassified Parabacteroides]